MSIFALFVRWVLEPLLGTIGVAGIAVGFMYASDPYTHPVAGSFDSLQVGIACLAIGWCTLIAAAALLRSKG